MNKSKQYKWTREDGTPITAEDVPVIMCGLLDRGFSVEEIARALNCSSDAVKAMIERA